MKQHAAPPANVKLICWNLNDRRKVLEAQVSALQSRRPELIALQEVNRNTWPELRKALKDYGFSYILRKNELVVASRCWKLKMLRQRLGVSRPRRLLSALVLRPAGKIELHSTHIPNGSKHDEIKVKTLNSVYKVLARKCARHRILCGDLNTPQKESARGEVFTWGQHVPSGKFKSSWGAGWNKAEKSLLQGLGRYDLKDVFRRLNGYSVRASSWRKYRIDHIFASDSLRPVRCRYLRKRGLSDHSPIEAWFRPRT